MIKKATRSRVYVVVTNGGDVSYHYAWDSCRASTNKVPGVVFKGFDDYSEASAWAAAQRRSRSTAANSDLTRGDVLYVDGSFRSDGGGYAGWAFTHYYNGDKVFSKSGRTDTEALARNIDGEIYAAVNALKYARSSGLSKVVVVHDYLGISQWALGAWKNNKALPYVRDLRDTYMSIVGSGGTVTFVHVRGHTGVGGNEEVDGLASKYTEVEMYDESR